MRITQLRQADLNLLVVFTALAEERSVSRAASRLLLSQPAVSRALQRLRDTLHDDLLIRTATGYEPTPRGERLLQELTVMLPRLDRLLSGAAFDPSVEDAAFRIAVSDTRDYERLLREKLYKIPGIRHSKSSFVLRQLKQSQLPLRRDRLLGDDGQRP